MKKFIKINLIVLIIFVIIIMGECKAWATEEQVEDQAQTSNEEQNDNNKLDELVKEKKKLIQILKKQINK